MITCVYSSLRRSDPSYSEPTFYDQGYDAPQYQAAGQANSNYDPNQYDPYTYGQDQYDPNQQYDQYDPEGNYYEEGEPEGGYYDPQAEGAEYQGVEYEGYPEDQYADGEYPEAYVEYPPVEGYSLQQQHQAAAALNERPGRYHGEYLLEDEDDDPDDRFKTQKNDYPRYEGVTVPRRREVSEIVLGTWVSEVYWKLRRLGSCWHDSL